MKKNFNKFLEQLKQLNNYFPYFPIPSGRTTVEKLPDDQLLEIIDRAKPIEYQRAILQQNYDPYTATLEEFCRTIKNLEATQSLLDYGQGHA